MSYILVVDDEPDICTLLKGIFEDDGSSVRIASNSTEALKFISSDNFKSEETFKSEISPSQEIIDYLIEI